MGSGRMQGAEDSNRVWGCNRESITHSCANMEVHMGLFPKLVLTTPLPPPRPSQHHQRCPATSTNTKTSILNGAFGVGTRFEVGIQDFVIWGGCEWRWFWATGEDQGFRVQQKVHGFGDMARSGPTRKQLFKLVLASDALMPSIINHLHMQQLVPLHRETRLLLALSQRCVVCV